MIFKYIVGDTIVDNFFLCVVTLLYCINLNTTCKYTRYMNKLIDMNEF